MIPVINFEKEAMRVLCSRIENQITLLSSSSTPSIGDLSRNLVALKELATNLSKLKRLLIKTAEKLEKSTI